MINFKRYLKWCNISSVMFSTNASGNGLLDDLRQTIVLTISVCLSIGTYKKYWNLNQTKIFSSGYVYANVLATSSHFGSSLDVSIKTAIIIGLIRFECTLVFHLNQQAMLHHQWFIRRPALVVKSSHLQGFSQLLRRVDGLTKCQYCIRD